MPRCISNIEAVGTIKKFSGRVIPDGFLACDGTPYSRTTYLGLFSAITTSFTATTTNLSNTLTAVNPDPTTMSISAGMPISGPGIPALTTVSSFTSNTIVMSNQATAGATVTVYVCPYGVGDGSSTFAVPDFRGRTPIGEGTGSGLTARNRGDTIGSETFALLATNVPKHTHTSGTLTSAAIDLSHTHSLIAANVTTASGNAHSHTVTGPSGLPSSNTSDGASATVTTDASTTVTSAGNAHAHGAPPGTHWIVQAAAGDYLGPPGPYSFNYGASTDTSAYESSHSHTHSHSHTLTHTHTMGNHTHTVPNTNNESTHSHTVSGTSQGASITMSHSHLVSSGATEDGTAAGLAGTAHTIVQPSLCVKFIIRY